MALIRSPAVIFSVVFVITVLLFSPPYVLGRELVGGRSEVDDVNTNKEVQELGRFSVEEYNRQSQKLVSHGNGRAAGELSFSEVVRAQRQMVSGIKYYLKVSVAAAETGETMIFDSVVVVKPWLRSTQLLSFAPSMAQDVHF